MNKPTPLSGFPEYLPAQQRYFNKLKATIERSFETAGFSPMETPAVEKISTLLSKGGIDQEVYAVKRYHDKDSSNEAELALRFDLTVPLARYVAQHYSELVFPFRRYQIAPVWRGERAQAGRYRQFYQCDIDIIGEEKLSIEHDVEVLMVLAQTLRKLELGDFTISINHKAVLLGFLESINIKESTLCTDVLRIIDKKNKITRQMLTDELQELIDADQVTEILLLLDLQGGNDFLIKYLQEKSKNSLMLAQGLEELSKVLSLAEIFGCADALKVDVSLARGLAYYTGIIFETTLNEYPQLGSVASGGRYDNLAEKFSKKSLPGIGMSIGLSRLFAVLSENKLAHGSASPAIALIAVQEREQLALYVQCAQNLRNAGLNIELYLEDKKLAQQFKYADKKAIPYVITANSDEINQGLWVLKNMHTGLEEKVPQESLIKALTEEV